MATGPDSADPKQLLSDLRQIAAVCQRLGIDLGKVAAMGQTIGGKATGGGHGPGIQNQDHASSHPGGGTGYTNLAAGAIIGSAMSDKMRNMGYGSNSSGRNNPVKWMTKEGRLVNAPFGKEANSLKGNLAWRAVAEDLLASGPDKVLSAGIGSRSIDIRKQYSQDRYNRTGRYDPSSRGRAMPHNLFGDRYQKRMIRTFATLHGIMTAYGALTDPVDETKGESRAGKIGHWAIGVGEVGVGAMEVSAMMKMGTAMRRGWAAGGASLAGRGMGALGGARMIAGRVALPLLLAEGALQAGGQILGQAQVRGEAKYILGEAKEGWSSSIKPRDTSSSKTPLKIDGDLAKRFMDEVVQPGLYTHYRDEFGNRKERSWLGKHLAGQFGIRMFTNSDEKQKKDLEERVKEAQKAHESAKKKIAVGDYRGAMEQINKAKEAIPMKELQSFMWKDPVKFLKQLESSRISSRNWARSQQPRGASRTGD